MTVMVDEDAVREFLETISRHAVELAKASGRPGVLQLCVLSPHNEKMTPHRFQLDDVGGMVKTAVSAAEAGLNVYIETRTVRADLRGAQRGGIDDTVFVFGLVVDADHDKGKGGVVRVRPSLATETSPGNFHYWYLLAQLIAAARARTIGDAIRKATGADQDTGVVTQCYRVPGTPNYPSRAKQARGRTAVEPTRLVERTGRVWDPDELLAAHATAAASATPSPTNAVIAVDESSLPDDLVKAIREGGAGKGQGDASRSGFFHHVVGELKKRRWSADQIHAVLEKHPGGVAAKYQGRLLEEIERSYKKVENGGAAAPQTAPGGSGSGSSPPPPPSGAPQPGASAPGATPSAHVLPTIRVRDGQLTSLLTEIEQAIRAAGLPVFVRAGHLVLPVSEYVRAADNRRTRVARLRQLKPYSLIQQVAKAAIFQRYNVRKRAWADIDPPMALVQMLLEREGEWTFPSVTGVIVTPTLRADGSLLDAPGYDPTTELYLAPGLTLPSIPQSPTRDDALAALVYLKDLFSEFSFKNKNPAIDLSVALAGTLTALLRGSLPTAPMFIVKGNAPGVGKSCLVDVISIIATGRACPVLRAGRNPEETDKHIGAALLDGRAIISLDNLTHHLEGELICQMTERPIVSVRILGLSESPDCECRVTVFATGNNVGLKGDMVRRGLQIELAATRVRPELRKFKRKVQAQAAQGRADYVAAALTIVRAYMVAGKPEVCGPFGSYNEWAEMARAPLVWLGEPDPCASIDAVRAEDDVLADLESFVCLWLDYLEPMRAYTTTQIIEVDTGRMPGNFNRPWLRQFLLKVAALPTKPEEVSPNRLTRWLKSNCGRIVSVQGTEYRLMRGKDVSHLTTFYLETVREED